MENGRFLLSFFFLNERKQERRGHKRKGLGEQGCPISKCIDSICGDVKGWGLIPQELHLSDSCVQKAALKEGPELQVVGSCHSFPLQEVLTTPGFFFLRTFLVEEKLNI